MDIDLGGVADAFAWGGGGRYLVARLPQANKLVVIDCMEGKLVGSVPLKSAGAPFTAGAFDLMAADDTSVSRWALKDLSPQPSALKFPGGKIIALAMGSTWSRQVAVASYFMGDQSQPRLELRDPRDGRVLAIEPMEGGMLSNLNTLYAAENERVLGLYGSTLGLVDGGLKALGEGMDWLDAGGEWAMSREGRETPVAMRITNNDDSAYATLVLPSTVPGLAVRYIAPQRNGAPNPAERPVSELEIVDLVRHTPLLSHAAALEEADSPNGLMRLADRSHGLGGFPERIHLAPQLGLLASVSWNSTSVRLRKFDLWEKLHAEGVPYLYITGVTPDVVAAGAGFECALQPESSSTGVKAELQSGPPGLTVDSSGTLHWPSPVSGQGGPVVVRFSAADGSEFVWSHEIWAK